MTLNLRGLCGGGGAEGGGVGLPDFEGQRPLVADRCWSLSSGTISAPVPFVSVSSTQTLAKSNLSAAALLTERP
jgi:hypothetical protein